MDVDQKMTSAQSEPRKGSGGRRGPIFWLAAAVILLAIFSAIAFTQRPAASDARSGAWWDWWTRPVERNAWLRLPVIGQDPRSVHFADAQRGWAVGFSSGTIMATGDGGASWRPQTSGTTENLWSIHFADAQRGWAVGAGGTIVATSDGGANWRPQT